MLSCGTSHGSSHLVLFKAASFEESRKYASLYMEHILGYAPVKQRKRREDEGDMLMPASMP